jgi:protein required for attachment to host cells
MIWVLVANQAEARIYSAKRLRGVLTPIATLAHAAGRARSGELLADAPGRVHDRMGAARHSVSTQVDVKKQELAKFVRTIVDHLEVAHRRREFDRLILVAAPAVLGALRKQIGKELAATVIDEIAKDLVNGDAESVRTHLR